jgi:F-type H+-transporting ATPase subunit b
LRCFSPYFYSLVVIASEKPMRIASRFLALLLLGVSALAQAQADLAAAQQKAEQIRVDGQARAEALRLESEKRTIEEMARLKQGAMSDLSAEAARVTDQLRREAANRAIEKALAILPGKLDAAAQARLIDQSINTLEKA